MPPSTNPQEGSPTPDEGPPANGQSRWLSQGWESLVHRLVTQQQPVDAAGCHCDVLIIGSGYGGAMAAAELGGALDVEGHATRIWLLERGLEYLPGSFPDTLGDLPGHVRFSLPGSSAPSGRRTGLFDARIHPDVCALVGNGLGGGSLINAGVMDWPCDAVFDSPAWPAAVRQGRQQLTELARQVSQALGATLPDGRPNTVGTQGCRPAKNLALQRLAQGQTYRDAPITVALTAQATTDAVQLDACLQCGDCATGCNHNAKISLDTNLLARAQRRGVQIVTGATAWRLAPASNGQGWDVDIIHTDEQLQRREGRPHAVRAHRVILAAGTLGSTELLQRSRSDALPLSMRLGERFSGNGDMITVAYDLHEQDGRPITAQATADEEQPPAERQVGPTITGIIDRRDTQGDAAAGTPHVVEDLAVPGPMRRLFDEIFTTAKALRELGEGDDSQHLGQPDWTDPMAVSPEAMRRSLVVALIGHDRGDGRLHLPAKGNPAAACDGQIQVDWPGLRDDPRFVAQEAALQAHCDRVGARTRVLSNPGWKPLPEAMESLFGPQRGPLLTVHPLGGCIMGDDVHQGVVNHLGEVFDPRDPSGTAVYPGLVVLDGSIVPCSLGINPALTIATLAQRGISQLRQQWALQAAPPLPAPLRWRPRHAPVRQPEPATPTEVQVTEQLRGWWGEQGIELTLRFQPRGLLDLIMGQGGPRTLTVDPQHSQVRVIRKPSTAEIDAHGGQAWHADFTLHQGPVTGTLTVLHREASRPLQRTARGLGAWFINRGWRDVMQSVRSGLHEVRVRPLPKTDWGQSFASLWNRVISTPRLASRAGEVRLFDYDLHIGGEGPWAGQRLSGHKRITYARWGNPWLQLMQMTLTRAPGLTRQRGPVLSLNLGYLAEQGIPLMRVTRQQHMPHTLMDLISLGLLMARMLVHIHVWILRKPDALPARTITRLPVAVEGLPEPEITELTVAPDLPDGTPVRLRLTRFRGRRADAQPLLTLHGYSAGGTTYAHRSVPHGLARTLWDAGFDVWIADMRTSPGMPTATHGWTFEDPAYHDIPIAVDHIWHQTGQRPIDIFAHCMGSAMLWMGLLGPRQDEHLEHEHLRQLMPDRIRRVGLSQIAPVVTFDPANVFRAFVMRYFQQFLPLGPFYFRPESGDVNSTAIVDQMLDRLLSTLPYPVDEMRRESPLWPPGHLTPWAATRHRMDVLYGRDFKLSNISDAVLKDVDEHFGPLSLQTLSQAMQLARNGGIATPQGDNLYLDPARMAALLQRFPVMSVHGRDNALSNIEGLFRFKAFIDQLGPQASARYTPHIIDGYGHQDCLIGEHAARDVFPHILAFFQAPDAPHVQPDATELQAAPVLRTVPYGPFLGTAFTHPDGSLHWPVTLGRDAAGEPPTLIAAQAWLHGQPCGELVLLPWPAARPGVDPVPSLMRTISLPASCWSTPGAEVGLWLLDQPGRPPDRPWHPDELAAASQALTQQAPDWHRLAAETVWIPRPAQPDAATDTEGWSLMLASCLYPGSLAERTPPEGDWPAGPPDAAWQRLIDWRHQAERLQPELAILLGDQIYADATAGLFDPRTADGRFRQPYQDMLSLRLMREALRGLPVHTLVDDHEIVDNWSLLNEDAHTWDNNRALRAEGLRAYRHFQRFAQPVRQPVDPRCPTQRPARLWYTFAHRGLPFFMADTRTQRACRDADSFEQAPIMGRVQWGQLMAWIAQHGPQACPKFVASPSILLPRRQLTDDQHPATALLSDAWEGYPRALQELLAQLYDCQAQHVVFLSGDEHLSCVARLTLSCEGDDPARAVVAHSVHSSALYAPFPFANARRSEFRAQESFAFSLQRPDGWRRYHCQVDTVFAPAGDGFALLSCRQSSPDSWHAEVTWSRAENPCVHPLF